MIVSERDKCNIYPKPACQEECFLRRQLKGQAYAKLDEICWTERSWNSFADGTLRFATERGCRDLQGLQADIAVTTEYVQNLTPTIKVLLKTIELGL